MPPTASLPNIRVKAVPPFSKTGVDFAGPLFVKGKSDPVTDLYHFVYLLRDESRSLGIGRRFVHRNFYTMLKKVHSQKGSTNVDEFRPRKDL